MTKPYNKLVMPFGLMYGRDITDAQKVTAMWIIHYASKGSTNTCTATNQTLSICTGKSERQVRRDISGLCKKGYMVSVEKGSNWPSPNKMFDRVRYITLDAKVFQMPEKLEQEIATVDPEMSGPPGHGCPSITNKYNNKSLNNRSKTLATASLVANCRPFPLNRTPVPADFFVGGGVIEKVGLVIGARALPTRATGLVIGTRTEAPAPTAAELARASPFWHHVQKLNLPPRVTRVIIKMLDEGHSPHRILIHRNVVTLLKEGIAMKDKQRMPTELSLSELLQKVDEGKLLRKPAKMTGSMQTTRLSQLLREATGKIQFVAQHTTKQLGQLKQFLRVVTAANEDPEKVLAAVANNWHDFGYYLISNGKQRPKDIIPDPGTLAYMAQECVNFYRRRKTTSSPATKQATTAAPVSRGLVIGRPPAQAAPPSAPVSSQGAGSGVMSTAEYLDYIKKMGGN